MIVERSMHPGWFSNSWLVADGPGGHGVIVDTGGPVAPIVEHVERLRLTITHVLCTHHHHDHVANNSDHARRYGCPIAGHPREEPLFGGGLDLLLEDGDRVESGTLQIQALHVPGHTAGQLAFLVGDERVFTGDTLFRGSVGGTRAPGHTTFEDLQRSVMEVLMRLPARTAVHPGHSDSTTIGHEWEHNPFVRVWRGLEQAGTGSCTASGRPATLLLEARDYDGGSKCWIRFEEDGRLDVVPGSQVERDRP